MLPVNRIGMAFIVLALSLGAAAAPAEIVVVVSSCSPITTLSRSQVVDIFLGKSSEFPNGIHAAPIDQADGSVARDEFYARLAGKTAAQLKAYWSKIIFTGRGEPPPVVADSVEMKKRLAANPAAIGYIERSSVDGSVRVVP